MARIFISYHHSDKEWVREFADVLRTRGHETVYADQALTPGSDWRKEIQDQLSQADVTIVILTPKAVQSQWIVAESSAAIAYARERRRGGLIPIVLEIVDLPPSLADIQAISAVDKDVAYVAEKVDEAVNALLGRQLAKEAERKEQRAKVEATAADFIRDSQARLQAREKKYRFMAYFWYVTAYLALLLGVAASIWRASLITPESTSWSAVAELAVVGVILVGLIVAIARFSFSLGKSFMVEALRNADRSHAISFGEFYLNAYGDNAEWAEVKEAFQHWNIDKGSAFLEQSVAEIDPNLLESAVALAKAMTGQSKGASKGS